MLGSPHSNKPKGRNKTQFKTLLQLNFLKKNQQFFQLHIRLYWNILPGAPEYWNILSLLRLLKNVDNAIHCLKFYLVDRPVPFFNMSPLEELGNDVLDSIIHLLQN